VSPDDCHEFREYEQAVYERYVADSLTRAQTSVRTRSTTRFDTCSRRRASCRLAT